MTNINLHLLLATGHLEPFIRDIEIKFTEAVKKIVRKIPVSDVDVVIYDKSDDTIKELGINGYSPNANLLFISLNPKFSSFQSTIKKSLKRVLAHELYHCLRWKNPGYGETLFEALITEGLADHFDMEINNLPSQPWDKALTDKQKQKLLKRAKIEFNNNNYSHHDWFFGNAKRKIPRWTGYTLGFNLIGKYLKNHPEKKPSQLYAVKAKEFLKQR